MRYSRRQSAGRSTRSGHGIGYWNAALESLCIVLVPFTLIAGTLWPVWWYVVIHQQAAVEAAVTGVQQLGTPRARVRQPATPAESGPTLEFYLWFWPGATTGARCCSRASLPEDWTPSASRLLKLLTSSVMPLGILTVVVLGVILFGITTATRVRRRRRGRRLSAGDSRPGRSTGSAPRKRFS